MLYAIVAVIVLIIDQAVKYWTNLELAVGATKDFIPKLFDLTNVQNTGAAFSFLSGRNARWILVGLTVAFSIALVVVLSKKVFNGRFGPWMLVLVLAGGIGNCIDRIINGYVVDMFHFMPKIFGYDFPVFNVADIFVTLGGIAFCLWLIFSKSPLAEPAPKDNSPRRVIKPLNADYIEQLANPGAAPAAPAAPTTEARRPAPSAESHRPLRAAETRRPPEKRSAPTARREAPAQKPAPRPQAAPRPQFVDPFEEFMNKTEPLIRPTAPTQPSTPVRPAPPTRTEPVPQSEPVRVPQPEIAPAPAPAPVPSPAPQRVTDKAVKPMAVPTAEPSAVEAAPIPGVAPQKPAGEFSLEDILAEFK